MSFNMNIVIINNAEDQNRFGYPCCVIIFIYLCAPYTTAHINMARHLFCARVVVSMNLGDYVMCRWPGA